MARLALHMGGKLTRDQLDTSLSFSISWMHAPPSEILSLSPMSLPSFFSFFLLLFGAAQESPLKM